MFCNKCGSQNPDNSKFCSACGSPLLINNTSTSPQASTLPESYLPPVNIPHNFSATLQSAQVLDTYFAAFVGEKYHSYYRLKWFGNGQPHLRTNNSKKFNFNLAGFFLGLTWLSYRKMYFYAFFISMGLTIVDLMKMHTSTPSEYNFFGSISINLMAILFTGFMGNFFYFEYCRKKIHDVISHNQDEYIIRQLLLRQGGTSIGGAIGMFFLLLFVDIVMYALFAPRWLFM